MSKKKDNYQRVVINCTCFTTHILFEMCSEAAGGVFEELEYTSFNFCRSSFCWPTLTRQQAAAMKMIRMNTHMFSDSVLNFGTNSSKRHHLFGTFVVVRKQLIWLTIFVRCWTMSTENFLIESSSFVSIFEDIEWHRKGFKEKALANAELTANFAESFLWDSFFLLTRKRAQLVRVAVWSSRSTGSGCDTHVRKSSESN